MTPRARSLCLSIFLVFHAFTSYSTASSTAERQKAQITVLYDAFGQASQMQKDWGYAALIEFGGKRILFDTGTIRKHSPTMLRLKASIYRGSISW